ncbi:MAG TPA: hypothetical protein VN911_06525 [Candidatus Acidoferrum sp.]|nr:hypothetical protein [Candidatus Acidoferrum sp.]
MKRPWDAVIWWEIRRIPFNLIILAVAIASGLVIAFVASRLLGPDADSGNPFIGAILYAIGANVCYTVGWISELLWSWGNTAQTEKIRPKVFRTGLIFSAGLTLLPAIVIPLVWAIQNHR